MSMKKMKLRRYTSLPILFDMLVHKKITLLDPASWEDRNDSFYVEKYRELKELKTVLAICFTTKPETFHHWKVFAGNSSGACIRFNAAKLTRRFQNSPDIRTGLVTYKLIRDLKKDKPSLDKLPFLKRRQYADETEFRILYENKTKSFRTKDFPLDIGSIERITLSPWLPSSISKTVKKIIWDIPGCAKIHLIRTGVIDNSVWKKIANKID